MHPITGSSAQPPGGGSASLPPGKETGPLTGQQRTALESLITRIIALTHQQTPEVWASVRHDLNIAASVPLTAAHFPAAVQCLNQRLSQAKESASDRHQMVLLTQLLQQGNNRRAVSLYIREHFGQSVLSQLSATQIQQILVLLQKGQLSIPPPQVRPPSGRPLLPAEHSALSQSVSRLAATTGEPAKAIWQAMLHMAKRRIGEPVPVRYYPLFTNWLQARQSLTEIPAPNLHSVQGVLKHPMDETEWQSASRYIQRHFRKDDHMALSQAQALVVLNLLYQRRMGPAHTEDDDAWNKTPEPAGPLTRLFSRPAVGLVLLIMLCFVVWYLW
ncbi:hypothetical protein [Shimwellia blattae]|uniref:Cell division protein n=1 Tax=Shimwellia blattae (strain ATCC 29907 / DSM 4481 / JCM 1650 / NBRC 105725 / CDC 9005-74) TaxID=630626 RepID=I2B725_SHIBC|nr:hypothetical protein [Shimwellia blattae]AFJ46329.1 cell division protein [Shimwellia blattae DSM 4481 = NBRC 105725]GAB79912.1 flagellar regulator Flk [Shimwellia blattae DSM 4481 = NBRC 105725]VDY63795.1 Flagellar regulator flk [Shimwellia blattae]VEC21933.1 Flagellar regulator flk [Shimwellia blattae]